MGNLFYKIMFWIRKFPDISKVKEPKDPNKNLITPEVYMMSGVTIGNLPYISKEWNRIYQKGTDPEFKPGLPWDDKGEYSPDNVIQTADGIQVIARKEEGIGTYGALWSNFTIKYGIIRAKIKLPFVKGSWTAFWTFNGLPESDIFEHCGDWHNRVTSTHHWGYDYNNNEPPEPNYGKKSTTNNERVNRKFRPAQRYYIYEIEITPYKMIWRINGRKVRVMKKGISNTTHILLTSVKGSYCGSGKYDGLLKDAIMNVEWIKVYRTAK